MRTPDLKPLFQSRTRLGLTAGAAVLATGATALALAGPGGTAVAAPRSAATPGRVAAPPSAADPAAPSNSASAPASGSAAGAPSTAASTPAPAAPSTTAAKSAPAPAPASAPSTAAQQAAAAAAPSTAGTQSAASVLANAIAADNQNVSVAVQDLTTGAGADYNSSSDYVTASIIKVDILATLLYQNQQAGTSLTSDQLSLATAMIENSDNDAAYALYLDAGGADGLTAANQVFGLTDTTVDDSAFGDTTTTPTDQIRILRQVFTSDSVLTSDNRSYVQGLMANVESDQRWGVSAAADDASPGGTDYFLKNGWLPRSATNLWEINSIGQVTRNGHQYLVAVLSKDNVTMDSGISVISTVAQAAVDALSAGS